MKLKCIYSNTDTFIIGKEYNATKDKDNEYFFVTGEDNYKRSIPLDGYLWGFKVLPKCPITTEQALQDGFVKIKSLKRCIKEGLVKKDRYDEYVFDNVTFNPGFEPSMVKEFGTIVKVNSHQRPLAQKDLITLTDSINWPIEVIEK